MKILPFKKEKNDREIAELIEEMASMITMDEIQAAEELDLLISMTMRDDSELWHTHHAVQTALMYTRWMNEGLLKEVRPNDRI